MLAKDPRYVWYSLLKRAGIYVWRVAEKCWCQVWLTALTKCGWPCVYKYIYKNIIACTYVSMRMLSEIDVYMSIDNTYNRVAHPSILDGKWRLWLDTLRWQAQLWSFPNATHSALDDPALVIISRKLQYSFHEWINAVTCICGSCICGDDNWLI